MKALFRIVGAVDTTRESSGASEEDRDCRFRREETGEEVVSKVVHSLRSPADGQIMRRLRRATYRESGESVEEDSALDPGEEGVRQRFIRYRNAIGWTQLRCAVYFERAPSTIAAWESPIAKNHKRIPAKEFEVMRHLAEDAGADSSGRIPSERKVG